MKYEELIYTLERGYPVKHNGKRYKLRGVLTKSLVDLPRSMTDHYETRKNVLVDFAELFDPNSNYIFTALAQEVTAFEHQSNIT